MTVNPYQSLQIGQSALPRSVDRSSSGHRKSGNSLVLPDYSRSISLGAGSRRRFSNYCPDPCTDYLNNPMFESLQHRRYFSGEKTINLRPFSNKKHAYKPINIRSACKVL